MKNESFSPTGHPVFCILGARLDTGNMGVGALTMGAITVIKNSFPIAELFMLDYDDKPGVQHCLIAGERVDVPLINMRFSKKLFLRNHVLRLLALALFWRIVPLKRFGAFVLRHNEWLAAIQRADCCCSIAGGDSFADIYGMERFFYVALPQILCLLLKIPLVHLPQTYGPFRNRLARRITAEILARSKAIYSRDLEGTTLVRELLKKKGPSNEAVFCYDVGFVLEPRRPASFPPPFETLIDRYAGNITGINISGLLWMGGNSRDNMFGLNVFYPDFTRRLVRYFLEVRNTAVVLVPHVCAVGKSREADDCVCFDLYKELHGRYGDRFLFDTGAYDQNEIKYLIGKTSFFIGARMHACIAALSQSIPAVGIAYSKKFKGVLTSIGVPELTVDPSRLTEDGLMTAIGGLYDQREEFAATLRKTMPGVKTRVLGLFKELKL